MSSEDEKKPGIETVLEKCQRDYSIKTNNGKIEQGSNNKEKIPPKINDIIPDKKKK